MWESFLEKLHSDTLYFQDFLFEARGFWREDILLIINKIINNQALDDYEKCCFVKISRTNTIRDHKIEYLEKQLAYLMEKIAD